MYSYLEEEAFLRNLIKVHSTFV